MLDITWMAGTMTDEASIWDDLHYDTEERAKEVADELSKEYGGKPWVKKVDWR